MLGGTERALFGGGGTPPGADDDDGNGLCWAAAAAAAAAATAAESANGPVWIMFVPIGWLLPLVPSIFDHCIDLSTRLVSVSCGRWLYAGNNDDASMHHLES